MYFFMYNPIKYINSKSEGKRNREKERDIYIPRAMHFPRAITVLKMQDMQRTMHPLKTVRCLASDISRGNYPRICNHMQR